MKRQKWIVSVKGNGSTGSFELSVVREGHHGVESFGWFDGDKLLVTHNGGPCRWPVVPEIWDRLLKVAVEVAEELNRREYQA